MADEQDVLMDKFLEKITPKLTDAVMAKVNETLAGAEKAIGDRMDGLADKNAELLGKLHKAKGTDDETKAKEQELEDIKNEAVTAALKKLQPAPSNDPLDQMRARLDAQYAERRAAKGIE